MALQQVSPGLYWTKESSVTTADGARIDYTILAEDDDRDRPAVVLLSGFLCPDTWWHFLAPHLVAVGYRVVLLHYRGIGTSTMPDRPDEHSMTVQRFAADALDVLHAAGISQVALVGHSMGGQVLVEVARRIPDRVWALAMVTATERSPFEDLYGAGWLVRPVVRQLTRGLRLLREPMGTVVWRSIWTTLPFLPLTRAANAFGPLTPADVMASYEDHAAQLPGDYFVAALTAMAGHTPPPDVLVDLDIPALVLAGDADPFTPIRVAKRMAKTLPDATLVVIPNTTHAAIIEAPTEVNRAIQDHLDAHRPARTDDAVAV